MPNEALRVGIAGGGQLARMMVQAAISLDVPVTVLAARADDAAALVWPDLLIGPPDSMESLQQLAERSAVITLDHELIDVDQLAQLEQRGTPVRPSAATMAVVRDKLNQRRTFAAHGLPVPPFTAAATATDVHRFGEEHGWPVVLKARRGGYDGRGVAVAHTPGEAEAAFAEFASTAPVLVEEHVAIERELAVLLARRPSGETRTYPVVETVQRNGMCDEVLVPAPVPDQAAQPALEIAGQIAEAVDVVGILAVELFWTGSQILINEIAARPHNTGHFSIEGAATSQFENHLRAVLDLPLGAGHLVAPAAVMVNVVAESNGPMHQHLADALSVDGTRVHLYGKAPRPGRKVGHVTALASDVAEARRRAREVADRLIGQAAGVAR